MEQRIIFACPFPRTQIAGGIRTTYRHAELLQKMGIEAAVFSPEGHPDWFRSGATVLRGPSLSLNGSEIIVINEIIDPVLANFLRLNARKQMFCQNQFYVFGAILGLKSHAELGISQIYCSSQSIQDFFSSVYGCRDLDVVPYAVDGALFRPGDKKLQIAYVPRKLPFEAEFIKTAFRKKFPRYQSLPWLAIDGATEEETARIMAESAVFLALGHRDSFGLPAVEAMSSGCAVVGLHGTGGLEFTSGENGVWFHSDQLLECVDALYAVVEGVERGDDAMVRMIAAGRSTAAQYNMERTCAALRHHFTTPL